MRCVFVRPPRTDELDGITRNLQLAAYGNLYFSGFPYAGETFNSSGISFTIYVPPKTSQTKMQEAREECFRTQDMLQFQAIEIGMVPLPYPGCTNGND